MSNGTLIGTLGDHAAGVTAQSIGGGGGKGGAAFALDIGIGSASQRPSPWAGPAAPAEARREGGP